MGAGQVQYVGTGSGYFVTNDFYPVVAITSSGAGAAALVVVLDKNSKPYSVDSTDPDFDLAELYVPVRVV